GRRSGFETNSVARKNSLHEPMKANMAMVAMPGAASGSITHQNVANSPAPSMRAASANSDGKVLKKPRNRYVLNAMPRDAYGKMREGYVFSKWRSRNST